MLMCVYVVTILVLYNSTLTLVLYYLYLFSVQEVTTVIASPLNKCMQFGIFSSSSKEKSWAEFHRCQGTLLATVDRIINHTQLSSFIIFKVMEELIRINHSRSKPTSQSPAAGVDLSGEEKDIVCYVGGFVLCRPKKFFCHNEQCLSVVKHTVKEEGDLFTGKLVLAKNRGGLCEPKNVMISFFALCESIFRSIFASSENDTAELHSRFATEMMLYRCFMHARMFMM